MKRKIATLHVYTDDETDRNCVGTQWKVDAATGELVSNTGEWEMILSRKDNPDPLGTFAHELGHFASQVMRTPAAVRDTRNCAKADWCAREVEDKYGAPVFGQAPWMYVPEAVRTKYTAESEAWDVARRMGLPINEANAEECLDSYREGVRRADRGEL